MHEMLKKLCGIWMDIEYMGPKSLWNSLADREIATTDVEEGGAEEVVDTIEMTREEAEIDHPRIPAEAEEATVITIETDTATEDVIPILDSALHTIPRIESLSLNYLLIAVGKILRTTSARWETFVLQT